ncbi:hypothetical protein BM526_19345 (plasmid) [Alteromonas mediterranea]|uniref:hypothetical protein n=1 Tax=Alteromonas mediterranea TaxID=314275 RepID=UPI0009038CA7|nr:hypothetical protein [Alteromonas mediterranea]APE04126.1 hypothetical protein BM526_19345 [Alteromonas mediterranea]
MRNFDPIKELNNALPTWVVEDYERAKPFKMTLMSLCQSRPNENVSAAVLLILILISSIFFSEIKAFWTSSFTNESISPIEGLAMLLFSSFSLLFIFDCWVNISYMMKQPKLEEFIKEHKINVDSKGVKLAIKNIDLSKYLVLKEKKEEELTKADWLTLSAMYGRGEIVHFDYSKYLLCCKNSKALEEEGSVCHCDNQV